MKEVFALEQIRKPEWLKRKLPPGENIAAIEGIVQSLGLHTVCQEANCPNLPECFNRQAATFLILGKNCSRNCTFCNVQKNQPEMVDPLEPLHVAEAVKELGLKYVVITSVTRDDLADGGAGHFAKVVEKMKEVVPGVVVELLIPDFGGDEKALLKILEAQPAVIGHNVETVPRLYPVVRPQAVYQRSIEALGYLKRNSRDIYTKSGIMVGLGETEAEVIAVFEDLRRVGCDFLTVGQYLAPSKKHYPVVEYVHPEVFERYRGIGLKMGFREVAAGPFVRSSYQAEKMVNRLTPGPNQKN
ncbi:MAG: lipoyl synthase [Firmicutes bacterium]|nr:lipoyl synthase [Bacillota bacterium]